MREQEGRLALERQRLVENFVTLYPEPSAGARWIEERLAVITEAGEQGAAGDLLFKLSEQYPTYGAEVARLVMDDPTRVLIEWLGALIGGIQVADDGAALAFCQEAAASEDPRLRAVAAHVCRQAVWGATPRDRWVSLLRKLLRDQHVGVVGAALHALLILSDRDAALAQELGLGVEPGRDAKVADELLATMIRPGRGKLLKMDAQVVEQLLNKLGEVNDLDEYWIKEFLRDASRIAPRAVVDLVVRRARTERERRDGHFRAIPYDFESAVTGFTDIPDREELVREVRDLALLGDEGVLPPWIPRLFVAVSQGIDVLGRDVLQEWIDSGEEEKLGAVAALVSEADWRFCLDHHEFARGLLRRAQEIGSEALDDCRRALSSSVNTRGGQGIAGEPRPHDVEARDRAQVIANGLPQGSVERKFYEAVAAGAEASIRRWRELEEEMGM